MFSLIKRLVQLLEEIDARLKRIEEKLAQSEGEANLYEKAKSIAAEAGGLSVPLLENRLHIGHASAEKLLDQLEENGIIDPYYGNEDADAPLN